MTDCNPNWTPALTPPLGTDPDRQDHHQVLALDLLQKNDREANWSAQLGRLCWCIFCWKLCSRACWKSHQCRVSNWDHYLGWMSSDFEVPDSVLNRSKYVHFTVSMSDCLTVWKSWFLSESCSFMSSKCWVCLQPLHKQYTVAYTRTMPVHFCWPIPNTWTTETSSRRQASSLLVSREARRHWGGKMRHEADACWYLHKTPCGWERSSNGFECWLWDGNPCVHVVRCSSEWNSSGCHTHIYNCIFARWPVPPKLENTVIMLKFDFASNERESRNLSRLSRSEDSFMSRPCLGPVKRKLSMPYLF